MKKVFIILLSLFMSSVSVCSATLEEARQLILEGDAWQARKILDDLVKGNPRLRNTANYLYLSGACDFESGNYDDARRQLEEAKKKGNGSANLYLGRLAFLDYDFDAATDFYADFKAHIEKSKETGAERVQEFERQLMTASNSLSRVENIVVIDSIALPFDTFMKSYRLPESAGRLLLPFEIPFEEHQGGAVMAYLNEGGDYMMWGEPDSVGNVRLVESLRLLDGNWEEPSPLPDILYKGGYADYPFMMPDGVTLYFASTGNDSMGGYDIFVVTRDATTGEYLQPQNVGMPFNSPYDDFMLAIDEENGVGWWATDRNRLGDKVTVYVYIVNDIRKNYDADDPDLLSRAKMDNYKATQNPADKGKYADILKALDRIDPDREKTEPDFRFPVGGGHYYTHYSDFKHPEARNAMKRYLAAEKKVEATEKKLQKLYARYPVNRADNVKEEILKLEKELDLQRKSLISTRSEVFRLERITK